MFVEPQVWHDCRVNVSILRRHKEAGRSSSWSSSSFQHHLQYRLKENTRAWMGTCLCLLLPISLFVIIRLALPPYRFQLTGPFLFSLFVTPLSSLSYQRLRQPASLCQRSIILSHSFFFSFSYFLSAHPSAPFSFPTLIHLRFLSSSSFSSLPSPRRILLFIHSLGWLRQL